MGNDSRSFLGGPQQDIAPALYHFLHDLNLRQGIECSMQAVSDRNMVAFGRGPTEHSLALAAALTQDFHRAKVEALLE